MLEIKTEEDHIIYDNKREEEKTGFLFVSLFDELYKQNINMVIIYWLLFVCNSFMQIFL